MGSYRKKPVVIEAYCFEDTEPDAAIELAGWCGGQVVLDRGEARGIAISTLEGTMTALPGDWIIRGVKGEFYWTSGMPTHRGARGPGTG